MGIIYLTRHGETRYNCEHRIQGRVDAPLTEKGRKQAEALRDRLDEIEIDKIYVSSLGRTRETASIINEKKRIDLIEEPMLMERDFGEWDGMNVPEISGIYGVSTEWVFAHPLKYQPPGGERYEDFIKRVITIMDRLAMENQERDILLVTHGEVLRTILGYLQGYDLVKTKPKESAQHASLTKIEYKDQKYKIVVQNDTKHLKEKGVG